MPRADSFDAASGAAASRWAVPVFSASQSVVGFNGSTPAHSGDVDWSAVLNPRSAPTPPPSAEATPSPQPPRTRRASMSDIRVSSVNPSTWPRDNCELVPTTADLEPAEDDRRVSVFAAIELHNAQLAFVDAAGGVGRWGAGSSAEQCAAWRTPAPAVPFPNFGGHSSARDESGAGPAVPTPQHPEYVLGERILREGRIVSGWAAVHRPSGRNVTVKALTRPAPNRGKDALSEAMILTELMHPGVIQLLATPTLPGYHEAFVLETLGGNLCEMVHSVDFDCEAHTDYMVQLTTAVEYVHLKGVVHGNITLENILVSADLATVKLANFGSAGSEGDVRKGPAASAEAFTAPELLAVKPGAEYRLNTAADLFSLGIVLHAFVFALLPWLRADDSDPRYAEFSRDPDVWNGAEWAVLHSELRACLQSLLDVEDFRGSISDAKFAVLGPWLADFDSGDAMYEVEAEN